MKVFLLLCFLITGSSFAFSQNLSGQWKGEFLDKSTSNGTWGGDKCEYVIDLDCKGTTVTGYSYTYFSDEGKRYYTICKLTGSVNQEKKYIEVTEIERTKTNVPANIRNCFQVHKLNYQKTSDGENLQGSWMPAPNQAGNCGFGLTMLSKRSLVSSFPNFRKPGSKSVPAAVLAKANTAPNKPNSIKKLGTVKPDRKSVV